MGFVLVEEREVFGTTGEWHHVERFHAKMQPTFSLLRSCSSSEPNRQAIQKRKQ